MKFRTVLLWALAAGALFVFLFKVRTVIGYFAAAAVLAYLLHPAVLWLSHRKIPLWAAALGSFAALGGLLALIIALAAPPAINQFRELGEKLPEYIESAGPAFEQAKAAVEAANLPFDMESVAKDAAESVKNKAAETASQVFKSVSGFFGAMAALVIIPILLFYFLADGPRLWKSVVSYIPPSSRPEFEHVMSRVNTAIGGFIRSQLKLCLIMGIMTTVAMMIPFPKFALIFGLIAGITEFIPYVGPILALIGPLAIACFSPVWKLIYVLIAFLILQFLEGNVIAPKVIGKDVGLHPAVIIFALMCGGQVAGLAGMIAAIPVAVILKVLWQYFYVERYLAIAEARNMSSSGQAVKQAEKD